MEKDARTGGKDPSQRSLQGSQNSPSLSITSLWQPVPSTCLLQEPRGTLPHFSFTTSHSGQKGWGLSTPGPLSMCTSAVSMQDPPLKLCLPRSGHLPSSHGTCSQLTLPLRSQLALTLPLPGRQAQVSSSFCSRMLHNAYSFIRHACTQTFNLLFPSCHETLPQQTTVHLSLARHGILQFSTPQIFLCSQFP